MKIKLDPNIIYDLDNITNEQAEGLTNYFKENNHPIGALPLRYYKNYAVLIYKDNDWNFEFMSKRNAVPIQTLFIDNYIPTIENREVLSRAFNSILLEITFNNKIFNENESDKYYKLVKEIKSKIFVQ